MTIERAALTRALSSVPDKTYVSLPAYAESSGCDLSRLPYSLSILLENLLRHIDSPAVGEEQVRAVTDFVEHGVSEVEVAFHPARVVLQDFTGVPAVVDLAAMREAIAASGGDPQRINPLFPSELVIDHSVQVDDYGHPQSLTLNRDMEYQRNQERYQLLRWAQRSFQNFQVVPPATGIVHQVNLEYLARGVFDDSGMLYPDTLVGTDSHTTMINGVGVLGWGVGGIEAEAAMLGQPINLLLPQVVGVRVTGAPRPGVTATDIVLALTEQLRGHGVVAKFVEFFGTGLSHMPVAMRSTISNMSPEFGSTCAIFPVDALTIDYLRLTGRSEEQCSLVQHYFKAQGLFRTDQKLDPTYSTTMEFDLSQIAPCISGPKRPQDRIALSQAKTAWEATLRAAKKLDEHAPLPSTAVPINENGQSIELDHGKVVIAAITSCTNTSNPSVMFAAGLLARRAKEMGLRTKPWVKTSLAPGSKVVTRYLSESGLLSDLEALGFYVVGYGCTTCIGNSGPLAPAISEAIQKEKLVVTSVLSGNRNFEGRINPDVRANYLASPPLVVAYALAGSMHFDFDKDPLGTDGAGKAVFLKDIWPRDDEIAALVHRHVTPDDFRAEYSAVFDGDDIWRGLPIGDGALFSWDPSSTYVKLPPFFQGLSPEPTAARDIENARALLVLGDSITTDHISPAGAIAGNSPAGRYLQEQGVSVRDFNSYGSRRGNHEVMLRGTFANNRILNRLTPQVEGGYSKHLPSGEEGSVFDVAMRYQSESTPLLVLAGKEYGSGSSRDWAAKGTFLLGIRAVLAESYERIHRSNLVGMGVLPLQFLDGDSAARLGLDGTEVFNIRGINAASDEQPDALSPGGLVEVEAVHSNGSRQSFSVKLRIDTGVELSYYRNGGILQYVLRQMMAG